MMHLTLDSCRKLQTGTLGAAERAALLKHLDEDCDDCDALVAGIDDPILDCSVDVALAALPGEPLAAEGLLFHRVEQRILERAIRPHPRRAWIFAVPLALAASAALFIAVPAGPTSVGQRTKGGAPRATLTAMVALGPGSPLEALEQDRAYPSTAELYFTYDLAEDAYVYFGRVGVDGVVEAFYPPLGASDQLTRAGPRPLTIGGTVHAYSLEGLRGKQRFTVLGSSIPLEGKTLSAALLADAAQSASLQIEVAGR